jgi:hypothetical protein
MEDKRKIANFLLKMNIREMDNMAKYSCWFFKLCGILEWWQSQKSEVLHM